MHIYEYTYLNSPSPHVRHEHDVRIANQARMHLGFVLEHVQPHGAHLSAVQGLNEGVFVDDGAPCGVDDHDAVFHLCEFGAGDYVAGVFLRALSE